MHASTNTTNKSDKSYVATVLLCLLLGCFGVHRFYLGYRKTAILMLLTLGGIGIWTLIDFIFIITCNFKDACGFPILPKRIA